MKLYGRAQEVATRIMDAFKAGSVGAAMSQVYIHRNDDVPCRRWSPMNQLAIALHGYFDARGFRQWEEVGRHVKKGEHAAHILVPLMGKREIEKPTGRDQVLALYGFKSSAVFGLEQTEGEELNTDTKAQDWINSLPLVQVARNWGLTVQSFNGESASCLGRFNIGGIAVGTENLSTWAHELCHAADYRLGNLTERGQHWRSETVAELGGAILLECIGYSQHSDLGGCWEYVSRYAEEAKLQPLTACTRALARTVQAVDSIIDAAIDLGVVSEDSKVPQ